MKPLPPFIYPLFVSFFIMSSSCKKEDKTYPTIEIREPQSGKSFAYEDTIRVQAIITDHDGRASVRVMKGSSVINLSWKKVFDNGREMDFEIYYDERYLEAGEYDLKLSASNGENKSSEFLKILLEELPRRRKGVVALAEAGGDATLIKYKNDGTLSSVSLDGDYAFLAFSGFQERIAVAPVFEGNLKAYDSLLVKQYEIPQPTLPGLRQYNYLQADGQLIYSYEEEGYIRGRTAAGATDRSYKLPNEQIPLLAEFGDPGMLVNAKEPGKNLFKLLLLNPVNGAVLKEASIPQRAVDMAYMGNSRYLICCRNKGDTDLLLYNPLNNTLSVFDKIEGEVPLCLLGLEGGEALVSTDQKIYKLNPLASVLPSVLYNFAASDMDYDPVSKGVFYASGLNVLSAKVGNMPQPVFNANDSIRQIKMIYNK